MRVSLRLLRRPVTRALARCDSLNLNQLHDAGAAVIAAGLKGNTTLRSLKCDLCSPALAFLPPNAHCTLSCTRSVGTNYIYVEGGNAIAAVLEHTRITDLE